MGKRRSLSVDPKRGRSTRLILALVALAVVNARLLSGRAGAHRSPAGAAAPAAHVAPAPAGALEIAWLGVEVRDLDPASARALQLAGTGGALVSAVKPGSPSAAAGLQPRDVITHLHGVEVRGASDLRHQLLWRPGWQAAEIGFVRDGELDWVSVAPPAEPLE